MNLIANVVVSDDEPWAATININHPGVEVTRNVLLNDDAYDQGRLLSFIYNGRAYDVIIGRARICGAVQPG